MAKSVFTFFFCDLCFVSCRSSSLLGVFHCCHRVLCSHGLCIFSQVRAATLSGQNGGGAGAVAQTLSDLAAGRLKLLFVSPERLASPAFRRMWTTLRPRPEVGCAMCYLYFYYCFAIGFLFSFFKPFCRAFAFDFTLILMCFCVLCLCFLFPLSICFSRCRFCASTRLTASASGICIHYCCLCRIFVSKFGRWVLSFYFVNGSIALNHRSFQVSWQFERNSCNLSIRSHNFRPAYLRLGSVVDSWMLPSAVLALTATAPQAVAHDVCRQLRLHKHCRQEEEDEDGKAGGEVDCGAAGISASTVGRTAGTERKATGEAVTVMELVPPRMDKMMDKDEGEQKEAFSESLWLHRAGGWSRPNLTLTVQQFGVENNSGSGSSGGGSYGSGSNKSSSGGALSPQRLKTIVDALNFQVRSTTCDFFRIQFF